MGLHMYIPDNFCRKKIEVKAPFKKPNSHLRVGCSVPNSRKGRQAVEYLVVCLLPAMEELRRPRHQAYGGGGSPIVGRPRGATPRESARGLKPEGLRRPAVAQSRALGSVVGSRGKRRRRGAPARGFSWAFPFPSSFFFLSHFFFLSSFLFSNF